MTGYFLVDWAISSLSVFNTILLVWLGLTVILNSDKQRAGIWIASLGLLTGGAFFCLHTYISAHILDPLSKEVNNLWYLSWAMLVCLPFAWYQLILWYSGFWNKESVLRKRQKYFFIISFFMFIVSLRLILFKDTLPSLIEFTQISSSRITFSQIPDLIYFYPIFILFCISLSIDALRFSTFSQRIMGEIAKKKAKPWLIASSVMLFIVSIFVSVFMIYSVFYSPIPYDENSILTNISQFRKRYNEILFFTGIFDILISSLISIAVLLLGQAIISYEIFTGKTLPGRRLFRNWLYLIFIASCYSIVVGAGLHSTISSTFYIILTMLLMVFFYSMSDRRFFLEREMYIRNLRPFLSGSKLYENLFPEHEEQDIKTPFYFLCEKLLEAEKAILLPYSNSKTFFRSIYYPETEFTYEINLETYQDEFNKICFHINPNEYYGCILAIPLHGTNGLIGFLLLGNKKEGGFYTQEEVELAGIAGERFITIKTNHEMSLMLAEMQRKKLTEAKLYDQKNRRVLHDDILPLIHSSMIEISDSNEEAVKMLSDAHKKISSLLKEMSFSINSDLEKNGLASALKNVVKREFDDIFNSTEIDIPVYIEEQLKQIPYHISEVIFYASREAIRNASKYAFTEEKKADLKVYLDKNKLVIEDNGKGISTQNISKGAGEGLKIHSTMLAVIGGSLSIDSKENSFTKVSISIPESYLQKE